MVSRGEENLPTDIDEVEEAESESGKLGVTWHHTIFYMRDYMDYAFKAPVLLFVW